jgi:hypothetical protein
MNDPINSYDPRLEEKEDLVHIILQSPHPSEIQAQQEIRYLDMINYLDMVLKYQVYIKKLAEFNYYEDLYIRQHYVFTRNSQGLPIQPFPSIEQLREMEGIYRYRDPIRDRQREQLFEQFGGSFVQMQDRTLIERMYQFSLEFLTSCRTHYNLFMAQRRSLFKKVTKGLYLRRYCRIRLQDHSMLDPAEQVPVWLAMNLNDPFDPSLPIQYIEPFAVPPPPDEDDGVDEDGADEDGADEDGADEDGAGLLFNDEPPLAYDNVLTNVLAPLHRVGPVAAVPPPFPQLRGPVATAAPLFPLQLRRDDGTIVRNLPPPPPPERDVTVDLGAASAGAFHFTGGVSAENFVSRYSRFPNVENRPLGKKYRSKTKQKRKSHKIHKNNKNRKSRKARV